MDQLSDDKAGGDVDHEYCERVTLAYLAYYDHTRTTRSNK